MGKLLGSALCLLLLGWSGYCHARPLADVDVYPPAPREQPSPEIAKCLAVLPVQYYPYRLDPATGAVAAGEQLESGELVVNRDLVPDVARIFELARQLRFPIKTVLPVGTFGWSDDDSMAADNTSAYNYRAATGASSLSYHALGRAIDINPRCNPYVKGELVLPPGARHDPGLGCALDGEKGKQLLRAFQEMGWTWGGDWTSLKDYQHFEKPGPNGKNPPYCEP